jgi:cytochrome c peroxidase
MNLRRVGALSLGLLALTAQAEEQPDGAYQAFLQALGGPAWIGSSSDHAMADAVTRPIPAVDELPIDPAKQTLGFQLYHDPGLSRDGTVSCATCHMGMLGGADRRVVSIGIGGLAGTRNAPTVFNSAFNFRQFWDGRAFNLDEQSLGPITNPVEMGHDLDAVVEGLASNPAYAKQFAALYPDGVTAANLGNAIAEQSRAMTRSDSRFNQYLSSGVATLSEQELNGWRRFNDLGCASCHNGINLGGNSYQKLGGIDDLALPGLLGDDAGLSLRTGREEDRQVFKVPSLHNVALTPPYFHDGSVETLDQAVRLMGRLNSGRELSDSDAGDIVAFLGSLSSEFFAGMGRGMGSGMESGADGHGMPGGMHQHMQHMQHMQQMQQMQQINQGQNHSHEGVH